MTHGPVKLCAAILCLGALIFILRPAPSESDPSGSERSTEAPQDAPTSAHNQATAHTAPSPDSPDPADPRMTRLANGTAHYNPAIEQSRELNETVDPATAVEIINALLGHYRLAYKENPVGVENFEFTEQLLGKNPMRIVFIDPQSKALKNNELTDQWDTPYFFHALSGQEMEVRSAGPDRQLWTPDDISSRNTSQR